MPWRTLSSNDVISELTPVEIATVQGLQGTTDALGGILTNVVGAARGAIIAGGNQLGAEGFVPDQLRADIIAIARWKWLVSVPRLKSLQTAERKQAHDDAQKRLDGVSTGKPKIELPDIAIVTKAVVNAVGVARGGRCVRTNSFDKLGST